MDQSQPSRGMPADGAAVAMPGILVADDDAFVREVARLGLGGAGFRGWLAQDGCEAVALYRNHRDKIDVVLLDVNMPLLDGPHALDAIRQINPTVRACFMSGDVDTAGREGLFQRGGTRVIEKPFRLELLGALLLGMAYGGP